MCVASVARILIVPLMEMFTQSPVEPFDVSSLKANDGSGDERLPCTICLIEGRNVVYIPCRHLLACQNCSKQLTICPLCRQNIENSITVYVS